MLEDLDQINWKKLKHAYGTAEDVPNDIRNLASLDSKIRSQAVFNLFGNIYHQGTRYEASPYVVPFLFELLQNESVRGKDVIIGLLIAIALGHSEDYLLEGFNPEKFRQECLEEEASFTDTKRAELKESGFSLLALVDCYDFVKEGVPTYWDFLKSKDDKIRLAALYAISWFPELSKSSLPKLKDHLVGLSSNKEIEIGNTLLALGLLIKQTNHEEWYEDIRPYLKNDSIIIKTCAAIALAKHPIEETILQILESGLEFELFDKGLEGTMFCGGYLSMYIKQILTTYGPSKQWIFD